MTNFSNKIKKQINVRGKIAKLLVVRNTEFPGYYITNCGKVYSVKTRLNSFAFNYNKPKKLSFFFNNKSGYTQVALGVANANLTKENGWENVSPKSIRLFVHVGVMNTWRPLEKYTDRLPFTSSKFKKLDKGVKSFIRNNATINHIDHNKGNNHVDNLEWCTAAQNSMAAHEFYKKHGKKKI